MLLSEAAERGAIAARSGQKQQSATQRSNAERLEKADEASAIAGKSGRDAGQSRSKRALLTTLCKILDFPSFKTILRVIFVIFKILTITLLHQNQMHSHKLNFFIVTTKKIHLLFSSSQNPSLFSSLHLLISEFVNLLVVNC